MHCSSGYGKPRRRLVRDRARVKGTRKSTLTVASAWSAAPRDVNRSQGAEACRTGESREDLVAGAKVAIQVRPETAQASRRLPLEQKLDRQLHQARRPGLQNLTERRRFQVVLRQSQVRVVEQVEALRPELHTLGLADLEIFE